MADIIKMPDYVRLKAQLRTSGLQDKNSALFQVIDQLIANIQQGFNVTTGLVNTISTTINNSTNALSDIALTWLKPNVNEFITADHSAIAVRSYTIALNTKLVIQSGARFRIL
jgi:hypothetical protein